MIESHNWKVIIERARRHALTALAACPQRLQALWVLSVNVEPVRNVSELLNVMAWRPGDPMRFARYKHERSLDLVQFQSRVELFGFGWRTPPIFFANHQQRRSLDLVDIAQNGPLCILFSVLLGIAGKPVFGADDRDVAGQRPTRPVDYGIQRHCCTETSRPVNHPAGQNSASAAAGNEEVVRVNVPFSQNGVDTGIQIEEIITRVRVVDQIAKFYAVARAASRVRIYNHVTLRSHQLLFEIEPRSI